MNKQHLLTETGKRVRQCLSPDLLKPQYLDANKRCPMAGHCYVASEALYHLQGAKLGYVPHFIWHEEQPHWFLKQGKDIVDLTKQQFKTPIPYSQAKGKGFMTSQPSKRAQVLIGRVKTK